MRTSQGKGSPVPHSMAYGGKWKGERIFVRHSLFPPQGTLHPATKHREPAWENDDPSVPWERHNSLPSSFPISVGFLMPGPSLRAWWVAVLRKTGCGATRIAWGSPSCLTPCSFLLVTDALDLQLTPKPISAELALNKDLEIWVNKCKHLAPLWSCLRRLNPSVMTAVTSICQDNHGSLWIQLLSKSSRPQMKLVTIYESCWACDLPLWLSSRVAPSFYLGSYSVVILPPAHFPFSLSLLFPFQLILSINLFLDAETRCH
jgi:hypothetical protein